MIDTIALLLAAVFLPLFPVSMLFNALVNNVSHVWLRVALFLLWPVTGVFIFVNAELSVPDWLLPLALLSSLLYALRVLTIREVRQWSAYLACSSWSLLWVAASFIEQTAVLYGLALSMSVPFVLLVFLVHGLEQRFGAAYTDLYGGLARTIPRFTGVLLLVVVALTATPLFPAFFLMLGLVVETVSSAPYATPAILLIWLLWGWAGTRLIQGLIVGRASDFRINDFSLPTLGVFSAVLMGLLVAGVYLGGVIL